MQQLVVSIIDLQLAKHENGNGLLLSGELADICLDDIRHRIGPPPDNRMKDICLVAHAGGSMLGVMRMSFPHYPLIKAEAPIVCLEDDFAVVTMALLRALQREVLRHARIEAELIQDVTPVGSQGAVARQLETLGFEDIGQSTYLCKNLEPDRSSLPATLVELATAGEYGMDNFLRAMVECSQPPITDLRTQPRCLSPEGAALTIQDIVGNSSGNIDKSLEQCYLAYCDGAPVAVAITCSGFVAWIAVRPEARGGGIGRGVLLALESIWREQGIRRAGLQVLSTNTGAATLYKTLGYAGHGENSPRIWRWHV